MKKCNKCQEIITTENLRRKLIKGIETLLSQCKYCINATARKRLGIPDKKCLSCDVIIKMNSTKKVTCSDKCYIRSKYVINENGCWNWIGTFKGGSPIINAKNIRETARYYIYIEKFKTEISPKETLILICKNKSCVNPDHFKLELKTDWSLKHLNRTCKTCSIILTTSSKPTIYAGKVNRI